MGSLNYASVSKDEKTGLNLIYSLIDSKIDIIDKKVRRLIEGFKRKNENNNTRLSGLEDELGLNLLHEDMNYLSGGMSHVRIFSEVENMSRSMYLLERMKLGLRPDNLSDVMFLLEDDKYLTLPEPQIRRFFDGVQ